MRSFWSERGKKRKEKRLRKWRPEKLLKARTTFHFVWFLKYRDISCGLFFDSIAVHASF